MSAPGRSRDVALIAGQLPGRRGAGGPDAGVRRLAPGRSVDRSGAFDSTLVSDGLGPEGLEAEREAVAQDARLQRQGGAGRAGPAVDLEAARRPAPERRPLAVEDDRLAQ